MDPPPPIKPPRGIKTSKETSGLLMKVIRTLSASESNEEREREKARLERDYKRSDQELNELVSLHNEDLAQVMQLFSRVCITVSSARERLRFISESLRGCKALLSCRRDELKKLWLEGIEQKHILELLEKIEQLKEVPNKLDQHILDQEYLLASKLLVSALALGDGALSEVEALRELRSDLHTRKEKLYEKLLEEITKIIYPKPNEDEKMFSKDRYKRDSLHSDNTSLMDNLDSSFRNEKDCSSEHNSMAVLVECLSLLNMLRDGIEKLKGNFQKDIGRVISKISKNLVSYPSEGIHPLLDLFNALIVYLKRIVNLHSELLQCFYYHLKGSNSTAVTYKISDVWTAVQMVLQIVLTDYLDFENSSNDTQERPSYSEQTVFLTSYFNRRKARLPRSYLFKFENSSLTNMYTNKDNVSNIAFPGFNFKPERVLVCSPDPHNILVIFKTLTKFTIEIEKEIGLPQGTGCMLHNFINNYVKQVYLTREMSRVCHKVESATKTSDAWSRPINADIMLENNLTTPILHSTLTSSVGLNESEKLLDTLDVHCSQILEIMVSAIKIYSDTCNAAYRGIVQPDPEDKRLCSATWLEDEDISRFLKSLPNWMDLQARKNVPKARKGLKREDTMEEESPEEIRQRNMKEADILVSNLGETGISEHEIISDSSHLTSLALMQESMEWFASKIHGLLRKVKKLSTENNTNINSSVESLQKFATEFEGLANTCLLVLHLEVRVQCFHYLLPKGNVSKSNCKNSQELEPKILELSRALLTFDDALCLCLQFRKKKYIFEGLGHLIAKILLSIAQSMDISDEVGVQKLLRNTFTLQQTITNITITREVALEHVRNQLIEMFNSNHE